MKILVPIKRVPDYQTKVKPNAAATNIDDSQLKWIVNPFDEIAIEEALKIKEASIATEVTALTVGPPDAANQLRYCMAMGADSAVHIITDQYVDSDLASLAIAAVYKKDEYKLVLMGKQAIDSDANQTGQLLAQRLGLPQACFASKVEIADGSAVVTREVDGGLETIKIGLPAVITADLRLNHPRYASLPGIMKAKKKPLEEIQLSELLPDAKSKVRIIKMTLPTKRQAGKKVGSVDELIKALKEEAKVI